MYGTSLIDTYNGNLLKMGGGAIINNTAAYHLLLARNQSCCKLEKLPSERNRQSTAVESAKISRIKKKRKRP